MLYALDSNVIIDILKGSRRIRQKLSDTNEANKISIPPYSCYEIIRGIMDRNASRQLTDFRTLQSVLFKPDINENDVMEKAAEIYIRRKKSGIGVDDDMDIFIGAWCVVADAVLVTANTNHFNDIDGLRLENWRG